MGLLHLNRPVNNFHFGIHELLMYEDLGKWGSVPGKQKLRVTCQNSSPDYVHWETLDSNRSYKIPVIGHDIVFKMG